MSKTGKWQEAIRDLEELSRSLEEDDINSLTGKPYGELRWSEYVQMSKNIETENAADVEPG